jgi:hypothetical protein
MARVVKWTLMVDWALSGSYTDESARLVAANGTVRLATPESGITSPRGTADQCSLTLANQDGRYSPLNTAGPLYSAIQQGGAYHAPMYLSVSVDNGATSSRVFTGVIKIPEDGPPTTQSAATVQIDCRSRDEILLNKRLSTPIATFRQLHDNGATEATIISSWLSQAGISTGISIDPGIFILPWAWLDDESPLEDIWQLAAACGGRFYCDQDGTFRYENMTHWLFAPHNTSQETLSEGGYSQMEGPIYEDRELYSSVTVIASPREPLPEGPLWSAGQTVVISPGGGRTMTAKLRQPAYSLSGLTYTAVSGGGRNMASNIGVSMVEYAQRVEITLSNSDATYAAELVAMELIGIPVSGSPTIEEVRNSTNAFWTSHSSVRPGRNRLLRGNPYLQTQGQAATLANFLRDRYQLPRLTWRLRNVPGDPFRRLGDRITLANAPSMTTARDGFLTAISWRLSNRGFVQDLELLDAGNVADGTGLYGSADFFVIGTNTLGAGGVGSNGQLFY